MADLDAFKGTLPYSSELFGVYQPLLGWRSLQNKRRQRREARGRAEQMIGEMLTSFGMVAQSATLATVQRQIADGTLRASGGNWLDNAVGRYVRSERNRVAQEQGREPSAEEWQAILEQRRLQRLVDAEAARAKIAGDPSVAAGDPGGTVLIPRSLLSRGEASAIGARRIVGSDMLAAPSADATPVAFREATITASVFLGLRDLDPTLIGLLLEPEKPVWAMNRRFVDPLANFDPETTAAVLSPVGLVHLNRQYFFEFDSFVGPPVGHVWISPGGLVELVEVSTRRTLTERIVETVRETRTLSEIATVEQDELAEAVKQDNQRSLDLGASASGGGNMGVWHAEASANFSMTSTNRLAQETTHKRMRQQSEKIANEIRSNFRSSFRTTTEVTDTASRRYVIQNTTDRLVNYELRRKMRKVGVQVQHIGTQLCWQLFVEDPGSDLGLGELVHIAKREDTGSAIQPPEAPSVLPAKETEVAVLVPYQRVGRGEDTNNDFLNGRDDEGNRIVWNWEFDALPPGPGYTLSENGIVERSATGTNPRKKMPTVAAAYSKVTATRFKISLEEVNFEQNPQIRFTLQLLWDPPDQGAAEAAYQAALATYTEANRRETEVEYVRAVRERIELAGQIAARPFSDLRQEERKVVFRRLIEQLAGIEAGTTPHVTVELIRSIFDIDRMLYFVAPDWWMPRARPDRQRRALTVDTATGSAGAIPLTEQNGTGWGGPEGTDRENYLITEDSQPAPLGSSLGWLLQLDGDNLRNAFLNSPWAKVVVPIRPGRERAALNWLKHADVEGTDGLDAEYANPDNDPAFRNRSIDQALGILADRIARENTSIGNTLASEVVFEKGFDPLQDGFRATGQPYTLYDQWIEVLPTDQVIAVEYGADAASGGDDPDPGDPVPPVGP